MELHLIFTAYAVVIGLVSVYYIYQHIGKLRGVNWE